jgi:uncharacterized protein YqjF (DUF2071 family)
MFRPLLTIIRRHSRHSSGGATYWPLSDGTANTPLEELLIDCYQTAQPTLLWRSYLLTVIRRHSRHSSGGATYWPLSDGTADTLWRSYLLTVIRRHSRHSGGATYWPLSDGTADTPLENHFTYVGCQVLTAVVMKSSVFGDVTPLSP